MKSLRGAGHAEEPVRLAYSSFKTGTPTISFGVTVFESKWLQNQWLK